MKPLYAHITPETADYLVVAAYAARAALEVDRLRQGRPEGFENAQWMSSFLSGIAEHGGRGYRLFGSELFVHEVLGKPAEFTTVDAIKHVSRELAQRVQQVESASEDERKRTLELLVRFYETASEKVSSFPQRHWG